VAPYELGLIYEQGISGVEVDKSEALKWYQLAATRGYSKAKERITKLEKNGA
jgi:TPR repeat protein